MKQLFGDQELALDVKKIKTTLIQNMLRVHLASVDRRLEACQRCPLIAENPSGFKAERSIDPVKVSLTELSEFAGWLSDTILHWS